VLNSAAQVGRASRPPARPSARERNRRSILEAAQDVLLHRPGATLEDVAAEAGVVPRTVYGHFTNRQGLVIALVEEGAAEFIERVGRVRDDTADPAMELAATVLRTWGTARRYGSLIALARHTMDTHIREAMAPFVDAIAGLIEHGQRTGVFAAHAEARMLAEVLESGSATYLRAAAAGRWHGDEADVATGHLLTLGVDLVSARAAVRRARPARTREGGADGPGQ
jgi:AcrR family transcriptional regulator